MDSKKLLIGWAQVDVTPSKSVTLAGQFHTRISEEVKDPVTATALAISAEDNSEQAIMLSLDSVWITDYVRERCREIVKREVPGIDPSKILVSVTHTHTAPTQEARYFDYPVDPSWGIMTPREYSDFLSEKLGALCVEAWSSLKPGLIACGQGFAVVGRNRRPAYFDGTAVMYGATAKPEFSHIEGYEDHSVDMLFTYDKKKKLTGMIVNLPCPSQVTEGANFISADFWHETREEIRARHGKKVCILPQCAAAGDQSPHLLFGKKAEARMMELKGLGKGLIENGNEFNLAQRKEIALRIAAAVDDVLPAVSKDMKDELAFKHKVITLNLPARKITKEEAESYGKEAAAYRIEMAKNENDKKGYPYSYNCRRAGWCQSVVARFESQGEKPVLPMEAHFIRLGDIVFASNRFELYLDFGIRIKARSRAMQTFIVQLAGEGSYLPTESGKLWSRCCKFACRTRWGAGFSGREPQGH